MKNRILAATVLLFSSGTFAASVPRELLDLLSSSGQGQTPEGQPCEVTFSNKYGIFSAVVGTDPQHSAQFQLGLGYNLESLEKNHSGLRAVTVHEAEESYSRDARQTLTVTKEGGVVRSVHVLDERKSLFGYKTEIEAVCEL